MKRLDRATYELRCVLKAAMDVAAYLLTVTAMLVGVIFLGAIGIFKDLGNLAEPTDDI